MMRVGIYLHPCNWSGVGRYLQELVRGLVTSGRREEWFVYLDQSDAARCRSDHLPIHYRFLPERLPELDRVQRILPQWLRTDRIELFHAHYNRFPVDAPCRTVLSLHDLIPLLAPEGTCPPSLRTVYAHQLRLAIRLADHVIVPSRYTQRQCLERLHLSPRKLSIIPLGCSSLFRPIPRSRAFRSIQRQFGLTRPYLLSVGPLIPRKNYPLLIQAFRQELWKRCDLVIVGAQRWWGKRFLQSIKGDPFIHYLGPVEDRALLALYAAAECFVYPSEREGFGLPPLEAMACGTPVVALNCTSLPEVVGDAGLLVKPDSTAQLAEALERVVSDEALQATLRARGLKRVQQFQWERTAKQTLAVYRRVLAACRHG